MSEETSEASSAKHRDSVEDSTEDQFYNHCHDKLLAIYNDTVNRPSPKIVSSLRDSNSLEYEALNM